MPPVTAVLVTDTDTVPYVAAVLAGGGVEVLATVDGEGAVQAVSARSPQVVVVELDASPEALPVVGAVVAAAPQVPVLTMTAAPDHAVVLAAVRAGATSHLVGSRGPAELVDAVRRTADGEAVFSPGLAGVVLEEFGRPSEGRDAPRQLTEREADVLRLVVEGLTARQIATRLVLSPRTVENHVQNVLRKLSLHSRAALVRYAIEQGLA